MNTGATMADQTNTPDADDLLADADYEAWAGPVWWRVLDRYPRTVLAIAAVLGCAVPPMFGR